MPTFTPPVRESLQWGGGSDPLFRHYGTILSGVTIYKNGSGWHEAPEGYDPDILIGASYVYLGGREYVVSPAEYLDLALAGYADATSLGTYPSSTTYPGATTYPGTA